MFTRLDKKNTKSASKLRSQEGGSSESSDLDEAND
jgi:hypothetical protein